MFVVIEGIESSGKTTLLKTLLERFAIDGRDVLATREPGGTAMGDAVRTIFLDRTLEISALSEALLANASRAQHVEQVVRPALAAGRTVLCDRFTDSTLAYQGYGRGLDLEALRKLCDYAAGGVRPDLVLLLDLPVEALRKRLEERAYGEDRIEREDDGFHERVRSGFLELAKTPRHRIIDATQSAQSVAETAWNFISTL
jgi:dTMP kinase